MIRAIDRFFFARVSATGFGLMRMVWGGAVFLYFLKQWPDVTRYYSMAGQMPPWLDAGMIHTEYHFSLLLLFPRPETVFLFYLLLLITSACAAVGLWPRASTIVTTILLFSFHERNPWHTTGGDVILRSMAFLLSIGPGGVQALSINRLRQQYAHFRSTRVLLPPLTMPAWPQRLLLWQLVVLYIQSLWSKLLGVTWWRGTSIAIALHHTHFSRVYGTMIGDALSSIGPLIAWSVLAWEACWVLALVPSALPSWPGGTVRRWLLASSLFFHTSLALCLRLGSFALAMPAILLGNIHAEDIVVYRKFCNRFWKGKINVLYDGDCGLCRRSMCGLLMLDWLHHLRAVNFRSPQERQKWATGLSFEALDRAMHIRYSSGKTLKGFSAFRALCWHMPALWLIAPILYIPGMKFVGDIMYARIAKSRKRCTHESCDLS